jgi:hypothetical protein
MRAGTIVSLCFALLLGGAPSAPAQKRTDVLVLVQNGRLFGKMKVWMAPNVVRIDCLGNGMTTIFQANSRITILNQTQKTFYETDLQRWQGFMASRAASLECPDFRKCQWTTVGTVKIAGLVAQKDVLHDGAKVDRSGRQYCFFTGIPMTTTCKRGLAADPPLPEFPGYPLRSYMVDFAPGTTLLGLDTISTTKVPLKPEIFAVPPGFKRVATEQEVEKTEAYSGVLEDVKLMPPRRR